MNDAFMAVMTDNPSAIALKRFRERAGLSMDALAEAAGFAGASSIQRYESPTDRSSRYINIDVVERLADALNGLGSPPITEREVFEQLAGALPPRLAFAGPAEPPTLQVTSSKATNLPGGSKGLALYSPTNDVVVRLRLTPEAIRSIREDLDFLESVLPE